MSSQVVTYRVDDATIVKFEIEPTEGFRPAGPDEILGRVREVCGPKTSSTSCDQAIFVDQATDASLLPDPATLAEVDWLG
jgi:hypothetical protein